jgi:branched-chain amino acid transport system substrate-binding protein
MLAAGASGEEIWKRGYQNVFGMWPPAGRYSIGFLTILAEAGIKRVAIVSTDDIFALGVLEGAKKWSEQYALQITAALVEPKNQPDMVRAAETAHRSGAQALLLTGHYNEAVQMRAALKQIGWKPAAFYAAVGPALQKFFDELGKDAHGVFSSSMWEAREDLDDPDAVRFLREFRANQGEPPSYHAAMAYATGQILEQAIVKAGKLDRTAVRQALYALEANSIVGRYAVDRTGLQIKRSPMIVQWQGNKREVVWPPESRTAAPMLNK